MHSNLDDALILPIWLVYVDVLCGAGSELACTLIQCDSFELELLVHVDGLEDMVWPVENYERIARYICLRSHGISAMSLGKRSSWSVVQ